MTYKKNKRKITSVDVANLAGVSRTTVSFVLNNVPGKSISEDTRQKVLKAAKELDYCPDKTAQELVMKRTYTIGLFVAATAAVFSDAGFIKLVQSITPFLNKNQCRLLLHPVKMKEEHLLEIASQENIDGIILLNISEQNQGIEELITARYPFVLLGTSHLDNINQVDIDNKAASEKAVNYLLSLGHRKIGMILHGPRTFAAAARRYEGFAQAMNEAGLRINPAWIKEGNFTENSGFEKMDEILGLEDKPTAIFAGNDVIAYGAISAIKERGYDIPDDFSVIGFDDDFLSRYLNPPLTSVVLPSTSLGTNAAKLVLKQIENSQTKPKKIIIETNIITRKSCRSLESS